MDVIEKFMQQISWGDVLVACMRILLVLVAFWLASLVLRFALRRLEKALIRRGLEEGEIATESSKRVETLVRLLRQGVLIVLWLMAGLVVLREVGIEIGPILASAGVAGLAIGFGAQNLVRDVIAGFFLILENQVRIGDVAVVNGTGGLVERLNFRTIILRDLSGTVHVFPNGTVTTLANLTREWSAYVFDIGVAYKEDVDQVMQIMREVGQDLREDKRFGVQMIDDVDIFGVDNFADSAVVIKGRLRTKPIKQWEVGREYLRRIKLRFDKEGIEIPFPHRSIYFGEVSKPIVAQLLQGEDGKTSEAKVVD